uniref:Uncharacterized protein n=1 Tax=viral metagenome TaxID=1070528 RepID=A0A6C0BP96_9ZZZZ
MTTTTGQKIGGMLLGVVALLGAILLVQWGYGKVAGGPSTVGGMNVQDDDVKAPCTAATLPAHVSGCGCPSAPSDAKASRDDLFPGSYTTFGYNHVACEANPRNQRC